MEEQTIKVFLSYRFDSDKTREIRTPNNRRLILKPAQFVHRVNYYLNKQANLESFCYTFGPGRLDWDEVLQGQLQRCDKFVLFWSGEAGRTQSVEVKEWKQKNKEHHLNSVLVTFFGCSTVPLDFHLGERIDLDELYKLHMERPSTRTESGTKADISDDLVCQCAEAIHKKLCPEARWIPPDGLPIGYPFDYEKAVIEEFVQGKGRLIRDVRLEQGCPLEWPRVRRVVAPRFVPNPIDEGTTGRHRDPSNEKIIVDVRSQYHNPGDRAGCVCLVRPEEISFLEAGPRKEICYPLQDDIRVGIVVSGGIAPGINAVIAGICTRHAKYHEEHAKKHGKYQLSITLYRDGFFGILKDFKIQLEPEEALSHANANASLGGSWISTARHDDLLDSHDKKERQKRLDGIVDGLNHDQIDILYVIGGEGTMRAALAIATRARQRCLPGPSQDHTSKQISVIGIPKTMDNDVLWVWQAFGFLSAVEKAKEFIAQLDTEAKSNPRLCIVQLFGSDSGFVVSHAALASGVCMAALIPEVGFTMARLSDHIRGKLAEDYATKGKKLQQSPFGMILLAETAIPRDVELYIDNLEYPEVNLDDKEKEAIRRFVGSVLVNASDIESWPLFMRRLGDASNGNDESPAKLVSDLLPEVVRETVNVYKPLKGSSKAEDPPCEIQALVVKAFNSIMKPVMELDDPRKGDDLPAGRGPTGTGDLFTRAVEQLDDDSFSEELRHFLGCIAVINSARLMDDTQVEAIYKYLLSRLKAEDEQRIEDERRTRGRQKLRNKSRPKGRLKIDLDAPNPLARDPVATLEALSTYPLPCEGRAAVDSLIKLMSRKSIEKSWERVSQDQTGKMIQYWIGFFRTYNRELYPELVKTFNRMFVEEAFKGCIKKRTGLGDRRVHGQTPDALRSGGLKVVSAVLEHDIRYKMAAHKEYWKQFRVFVNEPRHLIRAIPPSVSDVIFGQRLGMLAVDNAMAGYTDFMVSQWLTEYVLIPLDLVVLGRKRVPENGIFWKGVLQNTGQPPNMLYGGRGLTSPQTLNGDQETMASASHLMDSQDEHAPPDTVL